MFNEIVCLCTIDEGGYVNRLMTLDEVSENMTILLAFYHPDGQSDCDKINKLQADGVNLVAVVDADDTRQLPEQAFAMICCDDARFIAQSIFNAITLDNSLVRNDLVELLASLKGRIFHCKRFVGKGDQRIWMIANQAEGIFPTPAKKLCFCHGAFELSELIEVLGAFMSHNDVEPMFFALCGELPLADEIIVDVLYSPTPKSAFKKPISD